MMGVACPCLIEGTFNGAVPLWFSPLGCGFASMSPPRSSAEMRWRLMKDFLPKYADICGYPAVFDRLPMESHNCCTIGKIGKSSMSRLYKWVIFQSCMKYPEGSIEFMMGTC